MFFHNSYIYSISWEDYDVDEKIMMYKKGDDILTLTGGGCNILNMCMEDANVYCVDMNSAQTALLELKIGAVRCDYKTLWNIFGDSKPMQNTETLTENMSEESKCFWEKKKHYITKGQIYERGGMGLITRILRKLKLKFDTLEEQKIFINKYNKYVNFVLRFMNMMKIDWLFYWWCLGIPNNQLNLITKTDKRKIIEYKNHIMNAFLEYTVEENHYYHLVINGKYKKECCPDYLKEENYEILRRNIGNIDIKTGLFKDRLQERKYDKIIIMDHMDWLDETEQVSLVEVLRQQCRKMILLRSASVHPPYIAFLEQVNFIMIRVNSHETHDVCDKINMYASTWVGIVN
jgi:S-adenosylmethionine:diacylglycerol 3-amino-3-carboxypropyl transferase